MSKLENRIARLEAKHRSKPKVREEPKEFENLHVAWLLVRFPGPDQEKYKAMLAKAVEEGRIVDGKVLEGPKRIYDSDPETDERRNRQLAKILSRMASKCDYDECLAELNAESAARRKAWADSKGKGTTR